MPDPNELIRVSAVTITRSELESGIFVTALKRASAATGKVVLDGEDVRTFLAIAMADRTMSNQEWAELWVVYLTYVDRMTAKGLDTMFKVLSGRMEERAPDFGYTAKGAVDLFFVYHTHHNNMTPDAKKELQDVLSKFIC